MTMAGFRSRQAGLALVMCLIMLVLLTLLVLQAIDSGTDDRGARVIGMAAFDSGADPTSPSWELRGAQLETFQRLLGDNRSTGPNTHRSSPLLWWVPVLCAPWLALASRRPTRTNRRITVRAPASR